MNYQIMNTDRLLDRVEVLNRAKEDGCIGGAPLTQQGQDFVNAELSAIDTELNTRMPKGEFVTLLGENDEPVGFEPECYVRLAEAQAELEYHDVHYCEWA